MPDNHEAERTWRFLTRADTSAFDRIADAYPMPSVGLGLGSVSEQLYDGMNRVDKVPPELYARYDVKRGLRNADGSGVLVGLTTISNVHGYRREDGKVLPDEGELTYRGYSIEELVDHAQAEDRFGYEEVAYLLIAGALPNQVELDDFRARVGSRRQLPEGYLSIFPRTTYSHSIMNVLQRSTLLLYAFDQNPDDVTPIHEVDVALSLLGRWPRVASIAHAAYEAQENGERLLVPPAQESYSMAETILDVLRGDDGFTHDEAMLLDVMLMLHAEHGGGNNSTFTTRVLSSSGTDAYSAYAGALGSLKGPKHGGANYKAGEMIEDIERSMSEADVEVVGASNILDYPEYADAAKARQFLTEVESGNYLQRVLTDASDVEMSVRIGTENDNPDMQDCSVVTVTYKAGGKNIGTMGVVGPTRMDYGKVMAILKYMSSSLSDILSKLLR